MRKRQTSPRQNIYFQNCIDSHNLFTMMNTNVMNRRKFHRINFDERVAFEFGEERYDGGRIKNLSLGGMFVLGSYPQQLSEKQLDLFVTAKTGKTHLHASAKVVWGNDEGIGLKFTSMDQDSYMSLMATLINNAEQPAIILNQIPKRFPFEAISS